MARSYGKLLCEVWDDPKHVDFLALSSDAKVLYWAFCSQRDITAAGVVPLTPRRWRRWFGGDSSAAENALDDLAEAGFVMIDDDTAEVWVRSFIKHDGRLDNSNLAKSVDTAVSLIRSDAIQDACRRLLNGLRTPSEGRRSLQLVDNAPSVPSDEEPPGRTPFERPSNADANDPERDPELLRASSQQPAPKTPDPAASSQQPPGESVDKFDQIIDCMVSLRLRSEKGIRHPGRYSAKLKRDLPAEHRDTINRLLEAFPNAPISAIAGAAISGETRNLAGYEPGEVRIVGPNATA